ncbi:autotransporter domain-containing protein [Anaerobiospirillum succiniciproducens]|uniref:autotransporter domain-containing protein n=1 Tax=Anaerobiospirillum succiniciproducens TaxID=13335 RepID=UPI00294296AD|nr:autotransporter domain-containing protein [Anaerobiospirillum succiniciproducens]
MKKSSLALAAAALAFAPALAQSANYFAPSDIYHGAGVVLFKNFSEVDDKTGFRIPAIAAGNGILIAATDVRFNGGGNDLASNQGGTKLYKTKIGTKMSFDGGLTWTDLAIHNSADGYAENDFMNMATDPAVLFDNSTNTLFMLGFRTNAHIGLGTVGQVPNNNIDNLPQTPDADLILFTSKDHGQTWTKKELTTEVLNKINQGQSGRGYTMVLQGPGGGMVYQGKIFMPIQAWAPSNVTNSGYISTSGFIVSSDGGENWDVSKMLIPDLEAKLNGADKTYITSESNIFYHKGKIRLAVKNEDGNTKNNEPRLCYEYTQDAVTGEWEWVRVKEDFLPKGIAAIEGSTHSLSEDVYLVAFSYDTNLRLNPTLMTNTGAKIDLIKGDGNGYTSISSDDNNIYVLYEGVDKDEFSQMFKAIDWKHKDYAVLNTQMRNRAIELNEIQDKFSSGESFMSASYSSDLTEGSIVGGSNGIKGGIFIRGNKNVEEDMPTVAEYDVFDVTLLAGVERELFKGALGTMMVGYMNSAIDYANGSENDVNSFVAGYRINYENDYFGVRSGFNFMFSDNDLKRNKNEGLGKTARFNSQSFAISNELYKDLSLNDFGDVEVSAGMVNTFFKRDGFREVGGEGTDPNGQLGANNAILSDISLQSHELFVKAAWDSKPIALSDIASITFNSDLKYAVDVADMDKWKEDYISFTAERTYHDIGELYSGRDGGIFSAELGAQLQLLKQINLSVKGVADSRGEFVGKLEGKVSL